MQVSMVLESRSPQRCLLTLINKCGGYRICMEIDCDIMELATQLAMVRGSLEDLRVERETMIKG